MAVLSGTATIRFGVADTVEDLDMNTYGSGKEPGGIEIEARAGDVFVIPSGVAHKTFRTSPSASFKLLTDGDGHGIAAEEVSNHLKSISLSGFTMIGAYPRSNAGWDFQTGSEDDGHHNKVRPVPKPDSDPVLGHAPVGLCGQWE